MCSRFLSGVALGIALFLSSAQAEVLRVCADPNNLPFSNQAQEGFENRIAEILARRLGTTLEYTWWSERKFFVKHSLDEHRCDVLIGIPTLVSGLSVTKPYYRSTYVFASRKDRDLRLSSLTDSRLSDWRIGIHVVGDDYAPPAAALARRGLSANLVGFSLFGAYGEADPASKLMKAAATGVVDLAIVWGPFAGYFAKHEAAPMEIVPVNPAMYLAVPFTYDISVGVRKGETELRDKLDRALTEECGPIRSLLTQYGIPQLRESGSSCEAAPRSASVSSH